MALQSTMKKQFLTAADIIKMILQQKSLALLLNIPVTHPQGLWELEQPYM